METSAEKYKKYIERYRVRKYDYITFSIEKCNEAIDLLDQYIEKEREIFEERIKDYQYRKSIMERELNDLEKEKSSLEENNEAYPL